MFWFVTSVLFIVREKNGKKEIPILVLWGVYLSKKILLSRNKVFFPPIEMESVCCLSDIICCKYGD